MENNDNKTESVEDLKKQIEELRKELVIAQGQAFKYKELFFKVELDSEIEAGQNRTKILSFLRGRLSADDFLDLCEDLGFDPKLAYRKPREEPSTLNEFLNNPKTGLASLS